MKKFVCSAPIEIVIGDELLAAMKEIGISFSDIGEGLEISAPRKPIGFRCSWMDKEEKEPEPYAKELGYLGKYFKK